MSDDEEDLPKKPPGSGAVVAWGLVLFAACRLLEIFLEAQATASAVGQAVLVEWGASRLGVQWSSTANEPSAAQIAKRALTGTSLGLVAAFLIVALLRITGSAGIDSVQTAIPVFLIGFITAALHAWRDEFLLHGIVLRATTSMSDVLRVVACGLTSAGAALGRSNAGAADVVVAGLLGIAFGALWLRDRGAWMPVGAHTAFRFTADTLFAGGIFQLRLADGRWAGGDAGVLGGFAAAVALAPVAAAAIAMTLRRKSPDSSQVG